MLHQKTRQSKVKRVAIIKTEEKIDWPKLFFFFFAISIFENWLTRQKASRLSRRKRPIYGSHVLPIFIRVEPLSNCRGDGKENEKNERKGASIHGLRDSIRRLLVIDKANANEMRGNRSLQASAVDDDNSQWNLM